MSLRRIGPLIFGNGVLGALAWRAVNPIADAIFDEDEPGSGLAMAEAALAMGGGLFRMCVCVCLVASSQRHSHCDWPPWDNPQTSHILYFWSTVTPRDGGGGGETLEQYMPQQTAPAFGRRLRN